MRRPRKAVTLRIKPELYDSFKAEAAEAGQSVAALLEERLQRPALLAPDDYINLENYKYYKCIQESEEVVASLSGGVFALAEMRGCPPCPLG